MRFEQLICGVDEVGRGPIFGSVVAAAVILDPEQPIDGLKDSKSLTPKRRATLYETITAQSLAWAICEATVEEIDSLNILQAALLAMQRAVTSLDPGPDHALIDGNRIPNNLPCSADFVIKGDQSEPAIMAASILAKEYRDHQVVALAEQFPGYGLEKHKGYPTAVHLAAIQEQGITPHHRRSFGPVKKLLSSKLEG